VVANFGLLGLAREVDDGFGAVVPAPWHVVALQVYAADPPVDAAEGDLVGLAGQRQAVPRRRVLPAEPVERLAKEPQLAQPRGGDGALTAPLW
jgi:hypothetical protein